VDDVWSGVWLMALVNLQSEDLVAISFLGLVEGPTPFKDQVENLPNMAVTGSVEAYLLNLYRFGECRSLVPERNGRLASHTLQGDKQLIELNRFGEIVVHPRGQTALAVTV
jgi:hypothetical protein